MSHFNYDTLIRQYKLNYSNSYLKNFYYPETHLLLYYHHFLRRRLTLKLSLIVIALEYDPVKKDNLITLYNGIKTFLVLNTKLYNYYRTRKFIGRITRLAINKSKNKDLWYRRNDLLKYSADQASHTNITITVNRKQKLYRIADIIIRVRPLNKLLFICLFAKLSFIFFKTPIFILCPRKRKRNLRAISLGFIIKFKQKVRRINYLLKKNLIFLSFSTRYHRLKYKARNLLIKPFIKRRKSKYFVRTKHLYYYRRYINKKNSKRLFKLKRSHLFKHLISLKNLNLNKSRHRTFISRKNTILIKLKTEKKLDHEPELNRYHNKYIKVITSKKKFNITRTKRRSRYYMCKGLITQKIEKKNKIRKKFNKKRSKKVISKRYKKKPNINRFILRTHRSRTRFIFNYRNLRLYKNNTKKKIKLRFKGVKKYIKSVNQGNMGLVRLLKRQYV